MKTISIYNNNTNDNKTRREDLSQKIKDNGYSTGKDGDLIFVLGGDGTYLKAIERNMKKNPIFIGINTGNLGFLSEFFIDDVDRIFDMIRKKQYKIQSIPIYEAIITTKNQVKRLYFINDISIERKTTKIIHNAIQVNNEKFGTVSGDGILISSSIGSTAYAISTKGAISFDCDDVIQINALNPIHTKAYHSLLHTVILKDTNEITISPYHKKKIPIRIACDGREVKLNDIRSVVVRKSPFKAQFFRSLEYSDSLNTRTKILEDNQSLEL